MLLFLNGALKRFVKSEMKIIHYFQIWCLYNSELRIFPTETIGAKLSELKTFQAGKTTTSSTFFIRKRLKRWRCQMESHLKLQRQSL